jgi:nicotinamide riboside kinase
LKIALTGAHGVGKTTLARELTHSLTSIHGLTAVMTPEVPRVICDLAGDATFFRRGSNNPLKQLILLYGQLEFEIEAGCNDVAIVVCDRSIIDHWAYAMNLFTAEYRSADVFSICETMVARHCSKYDRLYRIPIEFPPVDDGTREDDAEFQAAIDSAIVEFLNEHGLVYSTISGTVEERVHAIVADVRACLGKEFR